MKNRIKWIQWTGLIVGLLIYIAVLTLLNKPFDGQVATAASKNIFQEALVTEVLNDQASPDAWTEGLRIGVQEVLVKVESGDFKGEELYAVNYLNAYGNVDLQEGTRIIVRMDRDQAGNPRILAISNYNRGLMLIGLLGVFLTLLIVIGGKKGIAAIIGLTFTLVSIWFLLIPLIKRGANPILSAILLVAITTFVSLVTLNGFSKKTYIAIAGCVGGVTIAGLIAYVAGLISPISGFNMPEAEELILRGAEDGLRISGLLVSGVLIASLGAVMDVALTIASAISELSEMNPQAGPSVLFKSGMRIGRDAMGTMANTLILAFAGASLNMLILFQVFDYPYLQIFNSDLMSIEIIQGLAGSIGIVLTVPLVAVLGATSYGFRHT